MKRVGRFIENILTDKVSGELTAWITLGALFLILVEVSARYFFNRPLVVADEFGGYALVAITFLGLGYTFKAKAHVRISMVVDRLSPRVRNVVRVVTLSLVIIFTAMLLFASYQLVEYSHLHGMRAMTIRRTLLEYPRSLIFIGLIVLLPQLIVTLIKTIRNLRSPEGEA